MLSFSCFIIRSTVRLFILGITSDYAASLLAGGSGFLLLRG